MQKTDIDYSNTIIYKIICKDTNVTDLYVGHTTNFVQRKRSHKQSCINDKSCNYNCKLYEVIRNNGGWYNWKMSIVNFFDCKDQYEARVKEQEYFVSLNATLNSIEPIATPKTNFKNVTVKENKEIIPTVSHIFNCEKCYYISSRKSHWDRHINTQKHKNNDKLLTILDIKNSKQFHTCHCGKKYVHRQSLSIHKKTCITTEKQDKQNIVDNMDELLNYIIKENQSFKKLILEITNKNS